MKIYWVQKWLVNPFWPSKLEPFYSSSQKIDDRRSLHHAQEAVSGTRSTPYSKCLHLCKKGHDQVPGRSNPRRRIPGIHGWSMGDPWVTEPLLQSPCKTKDLHLVGGWATRPSEKCQLGWWNSQLNWKKRMYKNVPNHQPVSMNVNQCSLGFQTISRFLQCGYTNN